MPEPATDDNVLASRYASASMRALWTSQRRITLWRELWIVLAETQRELGLSISQDQITALRAARDSIDFEAAQRYEQRFRHDVMAHIHAFGDAAPGARGILHLGATSCYVTDNADLILMREGLGLLCQRVAAAIRNLAAFARRYRDLPTLGFTHFQPAQLTTVGKRATLWLYDLVMDLEELERRKDRMLFRGAKGTTGTQAGFLALFEGNEEKVRQLDERIAARFGFPGSHPVTGQTYSRKVDSQVLDVLSGVGQSAHKFATDVRLLSHRRELEEPFEAEQVGSSAMAYKRNPMRCERMCALARFVMNLTANAAQTAATQWLERTLDDSANRRIVLPQAFLATDGVLRLYENVSAGLVVHEAVIARAVENELPFMATENLLMAASRAGGDRQALHETIRRHSLAAAERIKNEGAPNDLLERLRAEPVFAGVDWDKVLDPAAYVGRAPRQVDEFLARFVEPILARYPAGPAESAKVEV